ncbi:MAG: putative polymerase subfamily sigma factor [Acidimicrobiia bacterium]|nr:putative polymerase subfamily sigma factor [Acidimicrobiia bacterium]
MPRTPTAPCGAFAVLCGLVDPAVLDAFQRRDPAAVRTIVEAYGNLVYVVAHRVLGQRELAEEASQQTFVRAWQSADRIDTSRDPAPWLATIAKNTAIDILRRESRRQVTPLTQVAENHQAMVAQPPDTEAFDAVWHVRQAIDTLPADEAAVVRLQHLAGLTQVEIAEKLGIALGTVKSRSHRAHRKLASLLGHLRGDIDE